MSKLRAYCELIRLPNAFTAIADVMAGYWLVSPEWRWTRELGLLILASAALYSAGIVFNDLADRDVDRMERPRRPLPSGRISPRHAWMIGVALSLLGLAAAIAVAALRASAILPPLGSATGGSAWGGKGRVGVGPSVAPVVIAFALLFAILSYDFLLKPTLLGPVNMGLCRALNLALGMSTCWWFRWDIRVTGIVALFTYVTAFSFFGRQEAGESGRSRLAASGIGIMVSILLLGFLAAWRMAEETFTLVLWLALLIHIGRVTLRAIRRRDPAAVQNAMKTYILGIIAFDAVIASAAHGWPAGVAVLALLAPALVAGRWAYST